MNYKYLIYFTVKDKKKRDEIVKGINISLLEFFLIGMSAGCLLIIFLDLIFN